MKTDEQKTVVFEVNVLRKIYGAFFNALRTNEWRRLYKNEPAIPLSATECPGKD